jgi:excisionase family DNA binding protein
MFGDDCLLSTDQAAELLGISPWTLKFWRTRTRDRGPDFIRLGALVRYSRQALEQFIRKQTVRRQGAKGTHR